MTDKELLELAAKAAGLEPFRVWGKIFIMGDGSPPKADWNPLTDDGDAFRLAVKLNLYEALKLSHRMVSGNGQDAFYAAARRAVVEAAAELWRAS